MHDPQFYVVYDDICHTFLNDDTGTFGPLTQATQYRKYACADMMASVYAAKPVGPYNEGDMES